MCKRYMHLSRGQRHTLQAHAAECHQLGPGGMACELDTRGAGRSHHWETDSLLPFASTSMTASCING